MPDKIVHIRSLTAGSVPTTASFGVGEIAINVADGKAFLRQSGSIGNTVQSFVTTNSITSGSVTITGSIAVNGPISATSFTGSLFGTSSWAVSSSRAVTSSYAITASYALNGGSGGATNTGSLLLTASVSSNTITFTKGDGSTFPITVATGSGGGGGGAAFPYTGSAGISGSLLVDGNVGINTTTPSGALDVRGGTHLGTGVPTQYLGAQHTVEITATGSNAALTLIGGSATTEIWVSDPPTQALMFGAGAPGVAADGDWHFSTYNTVDSWKDRLVIKNDTGNVGIGTTTPTAKLEVVGQTTLRGNTVIQSSGSLAIGDVFEGGIVGYILQPGDSGYDVNYEKGLVTTVSDLSTGIQWYNGSYVTTGVNSAAIGAGSTNTDTIVAVQGPTNTNYAAGLAYDDTTGGYSDWYLPSKDELNKLYENRNIIGGFVATVYWSSTEADSPNDSTNAWSQDFNTGTQSEQDKALTSYVRAVRSFSIAKTKLTVAENAVVVADGNVGIGVAVPSYKLDISGSIGLPYVSLDGGTSAFGLNYFTLQALETDTGIASIYACDGNPAGYGYNFQFKANQASNGLLIIGDNSTTSHIFATDAYPGGAGWPLKFRVANTNENWGAISDLMTLTPDQKVGIGSNAPTTKLYVIDGVNSTVAHFEGVNGYPIEIVTANTSMTASYSASIGSIGNGAGELCVKTGSTDADWAPLVYQKGPIAEYTYAGVSLSGGDFTIPKPGIYEITTATANNLIFPDPASYDGQSITVVNVDSNDANIDNTNTFAPYQRGKGTQFSTIGIERMYVFKSIGGKWRGGELYY